MIDSFKFQSNIVDVEVSMEEGRVSLKNVGAFDKVFMSIGELRKIVDLIEDTYNKLDPQS